MVLIALPMFGDYYTPDLMSGSPKTAMIGNAINGYVQGGPDKALGAALTLLLSAFLLVFMLYYLRTLRRERCDGDAAPRPSGPRRGAAAGAPAPAATPAGDRHVGLRRLVAAAGAAGDPLRVQLWPLAHLAAGLVAALVLDRTRR